MVPTAANLGDKVDRSELKESEAQMLAMVQRKAGLTSFAALRKEFNDVKQVTLPGHAKQIDLALRFVDWFSVSHVASHWFIQSEHAPHPPIGLSLYLSTYPFMYHLIIYSFMQSWSIH